MSSRIRTWLFVAGAAVFASSWIAWRSTVVARESKAKSAALEAEWPALEINLRRLEQVRAEALRHTAKLKEAVAASKRTSETKEERPGSSDGSRRESSSITEIIRDDANGQVTWLASQRSDLAKRYGPLFRQLGFTPADIAGFEERFVKRIEQRMDLDAAAVDRGADGDHLAIEKLKAAAENEYEAAQRTLLGESRYARLQEYERTSAYRAVVGTIAGAAAVEQVPFSPLQAEQLVSTIADSSARYRRGGAISGADIEWEAVVTRAREILSPEQFAVFSTMDPGPGLGGLLQARLYSHIDRAKAADARNEATERVEPRP